MFLEALSTALGTEGTVDDLPESVEGLMTSQIDRLDPVDRTVLRYAAVLGFVVEDDDLQDLLTAQLGTGSESRPRPAAAAARRVPHPVLTRAVAVPARPDA